MSAIEAPGAPNMEDSQEMSSLSSISMMAAPPNSPRATVIHLVSSPTTDIPPPPTYKPPEVPISLAEKLEIQREAQCDGIVPPINTPRQSIESGIVTKRHHKTNRERKKSSSSKDTAVTTSNLIMEQEPMIFPQAPIRSASLVTSTVRQRVTLRAKPRITTAKTHRRGDSDTGSPISPRNTKKDQTKLKKTAKSTPLRAVSPPFTPPQPIDLRKRAATVDTCSSGSMDTFGSSSENTVVGSGSQIDKSNDTTQARCRKSMDNTYDVNYTSTRKKHEKEQQPLLVEEETGNLSNLSEFNIDCYFDTSNEYQGSCSTISNNIEKSNQRKNESVKRKPKSRFHGTHQRKSSEQLSGKSIRLLSPILPRSTTPPPILSPRLMESVTDAVTGIFFEPSIIFDSSVQLNNTEEMIQTDWPTPPKDNNPNNHHHLIITGIDNHSMDFSDFSSNTTATSGPLFNPLAPPRIYPPPRFDSVSQQQQSSSTIPKRTFTPTLPTMQLKTTEKCGEWLQKTEIKHITGQQVTVVEPDRRAQVGQSIHVKTRRVRWADGDTPDMPEPTNNDDFVPPPRITSLIEDGGTPRSASSSSSKRTSINAFSSPSSPSSSTEKKSCALQRARAASDAKRPTSKLVNTITASDSDHSEHGRPSNTHTRRKASESSVILLSDPPGEKRPLSRNNTMDKYQRRLQTVRPLQRSATLNSAADLPLDARSNVPASSKFATPFFTMISDTTLSMTSFATSSYDTVSTRARSDKDSVSGATPAPPVPPLDERSLEIRLLREVTLEEARADCHAALPKDKLKLKLKRRIKVDPMCACCSRIITDPKCTYALDRYWISEHFRCAHCKFSFANNTFVAYNGRAYCPYDYFSLFGQRCHSCHMVIRDGSIRALGHIWHTDCFRCEDCGMPLHDDYKEIDGAAYCMRDAFLLGRR